MALIQLARNSATVRIAALGERLSTCRADAGAVSARVCAIADTSPTGLEGVSSGAVGHVRVCHVQVPECAAEEGKQHKRAYEGFFAEHGFLLCVVGIKTLCLSYRNQIETGRALLM